MYDVISIGGATRDIFFDFDSFKEEDKGDKRFLLLPYGEKVVAEGAHYSYGGGALNTSISFSRLGLRSAAICSIGAEGTGSLAMHLLKNEGVATNLIQRDKSLHTGLSIFIIGKDSEHTGFLERGANNHLAISNWRSLKNTKWFYISSLTGNADKLLPELFLFAKKNNIKISFNPGSVQLSEGYHYLKSFIEQCDILNLNYQEAETLVFSKTKKLPKNEQELLKEIDGMGAKISIVTDDGSGSYAVMNGVTKHICAYSHRLVDTTGAGDCFGSTFTFGVIRGYDIGYSLKIASINAASVVSKMGATEGLLTYNGIISSKWH